MSEISKINSDCSSVFQPSECESGEVEECEERMAISGTRTPTTGGNSLGLKTSVEYQQKDCGKMELESSTLRRIKELKEKGIWITKPLPKLTEPSHKTHWETVLSEMKVKSVNLGYFRKWKILTSRRYAKLIEKHFQTRVCASKRAKEEEEMNKRRPFNNVIKEITTFWSNAKTLVVLSEQSRIEQLRKKALDVHLNLIVKKTEEYSSMLTETFETGTSSRQQASSEKSLAKSSNFERDKLDDVDFEPTDSEEDDEETIATADLEAAKNKAAVDKEVALLAEESEIPMDDFLDQLPQGYLDWILENQKNKGDEKSKKASHKNNTTASGTQKLNLTTNIMEAASSAKNKMIVEKLCQKRKANEEPMPKAWKKKRVETSSSDSEDSESESDTSNDSDTESDSSRDSNTESDSSRDSNAESDYSEDSDIGNNTTENSDFESDFLDDFENEESDASPEHENTSECSNVEEDDDPNQTTGLANLLQTFDPGRVGNDNDYEISSAAGVAQAFQPKGNTLSSTTVVTKIPFLLKGTLREYQHVGLDWLVAMYTKKLNGILADEMGLGKTIQTIALLAHLACEKGNWGPHLIVVPTSVMLNWELEFKKWCPGFKILTYFGNQKERSVKRQGWTKSNTFHVCITSYNLVVQDHVSFRRKKWKYLILDEAQNIKNFKSLRWQILLNFHAQRRLLLTGTPLQNNLMELWSLMHFLMPAVFQSHREFRQWFSDPVSNMVEGDSCYDDSIIKRLHKVLRPFLLRRLKCEVEKQMPKKYNHVVLCSLSKRQRYLYEEYMQRANTKEAINRGTFSGIINVLMQLRKVCNHPNLFEPRPVVSAFQDSGVNCTMPSLVCNIIDENKFNLPSFSMFKMTDADYELGKEDGDLIWKRMYSFLEDLEYVVDEGRVGSVNDVTKAPVSENIGFEIGQSPSRKRHRLSQPPVIPEVEGPIPWWLRSEVLKTKLTVDVNLSSCVMEKENKCPSLALSENNSPTKSSSTELQLFDTTNATPSELALEEARNYFMLRLKEYLTSRSALNRKGKSDSKEMCTLHLTSVGISNTDDYWPPEIRARRLQDKCDVLIRLKRINEERCKKMPVIGVGTINVCQAFNEFPSMRYYGWRRIRLSLERPPPEKLRNFPTEGYFSLGHAEAQLAMYVKSCPRGSYQKNHPLLQWRMTECLMNLMWTVEEQLHMFSEMIERFLMYVPAVSVPKPYHNFLRPKYTYYAKQLQTDETLQMALQEPLKFLHPVISRMTCQFPDSRLIQYDCGKLQVLDILLRKLKAEDHRVLLFTQMAKMLDVLENFLNYHGYIYLRLDGSTKIEERQVLMERFNTDRRIFCFILSTRSGGVGVNLTGADTVIFYDSDWNPTMDAQAQDRCHRIGQTRDVNIYRLVSERTIEENVIKKSNQKRIIGELAIEGGNFTTAYFKKESIRDIFNTDHLGNNPLEILRQELENSTTVMEVSEVYSHDGQEKKENTGTMSELTKTRLFERALAEAEDEIDANAAITVQAEAAADLEEFYENPLNKEEDLCKTEVEMKLISSEFLPVERYALRLMEYCIEDWAIETVNSAKKEIEQQKREWGLEKLDQANSGDADVVDSSTLLPASPGADVDVSYENSLEIIEDKIENSCSTETPKDSAPTDLIKKPTRSLKGKSSEQNLPARNQISKRKRKQLSSPVHSNARKLSKSLETSSKELKPKRRSKVVNRLESETSGDSDSDDSSAPEESPDDTVPVRRCSLSRKAKMGLSRSKEEEPVSNKESKSKAKQETPTLNNGNRLKGREDEKLVKKEIKTKAKEEKSVSYYETKLKRENEENPMPNKERKSKPNDEEKLVSRKESKPITKEAENQVSGEESKSKEKKAKEEKASNESKSSSRKSTDTKAESSDLSQKVENTENCVRIKTRSLAAKEKATDPPKRKRGRPRKYPRPNTL